jgi:TatA/E family protein of Tat protein translocase
MFALLIQPVLFFGALGMQELLVILVVILLLFGSERLPELARGLGRAMHEFKKATDELKEEIDLDETKKSLKP